MVKGTLARPAASSVARRTAGALSGEPKCGPPRCDSRSEAVSSMMPCETETLRRRASQASSITPGLRCGSRPVSRKHQGGRGFQVREGGVDTERGQRLAGGGVAQLGLVAEREQRLLAARGLAGAGDLEHGVGREEVRLARVGRAREGAVVAHVAAEPRQRDEHLLGEGHSVPVAGEAQLLGQRREAGKVVALRKRQRLIARGHAARCGGRESAGNVSSAAHD